MRELRKRAIDAVNSHRSTIEAVLANAVSAPLGFATQVLTAQLAGPAGYGVYSLVQTTANIAQVPASLDFGAASIRFGSRYIAEGEPAKAAAVFRMGRAIVVILSSLFVLLATFGWAVGLLSVPLSALVSGSILFVALTLTRVELVAAIAIGKQRSANLIAQVVRPATALVLLICIFATRRNGFVSVAWIIGAIAFSLIVVEVMFLRLTRTRLPSYSPTRDEKQEWLRYAFGMMLATLASVVVASQSDTIIVGLLEGASAAGVYSAANQLASVVPLLGATLITFATPKIASAFDLGRREDMRVEARRVEVTLLLLWLLAGGFVALFGPWILRLFGKDFAGGYSVLLILTFAHGLSLSASSVPSLLLSLAGKQRLVVITILGSGVASVAVALLSAEQFGAVGVALGTLAGMVVRTVALRGAWTLLSREEIR